MIEKSNVSLDELNARRIVRIDAVLRYGISILVIALLLSVTSYLWVFRYGLSNEPNNWSAFGSFFGGVFGPMVSVVTLVAILKTISLQREMMDAQREEYSSLLDQQRLAFIEQQRQTELSDSALKSSRVADYKSGLLQMLDQQSNYQHSAANAYRERINTALSMLGPLKDIKDTPENKKSMEDLGELSKRMGESERSALEITRLSLSLAVTEFEDVAEVKTFIASRISIITALRS
jgi:hypothetical protein